MVLSAMLVRHARSRQRVRPGRDRALAHHSLHEIGHGSQGLGLHLQPITVDQHLELPSVGHHRINKATIKDQDMGMEMVLVLGLELGEVEDKRSDGMGVPNQLLLSDFGIELPKVPLRKRKRT